MRNIESFELIEDNLYKCKCCSKKIEYNLLDNHFARNHLAEIVPSLYLGSYGMVSNIAELKYAQITNIINTAREISNTMESTYMYYNLPLTDSENQHLIEHLDTICDYIKMLVTNKCKVVVHCYMGISRSASIIIAYLIKHNNMSYDQAFKYVLDRRYICPNQRFEDELREFETKCKII